MKMNLVYMPMHVSIYSFFFADRDVKTGEKSCESRMKTIKGLWETTMRRCKRLSWRIIIGFTLSLRQR